MIRYSGINHLAMVTNDMTGTIRFWRDLLGMRLIGGLEGPEPQPGHWPETVAITQEKDRFVYPGEGKILAGKK